MSSIIALAISVGAINIVSNFFVPREREKSKGAGTFVILIIGAVVGLMVGLTTNLMVSHANSTGFVEGWKEGVDIGYYSGVPSNELKTGSVYQVLVSVCTEGRNMVVLRDPENRIGLFSINCWDTSGEELIPRRFYEYSRASSSGSSGFTLVQ